MCRSCCRHKLKVIWNSEYSNDLMTTKKLIFPPSYLKELFCSSLLFILFFSTGKPSFSIHYLFSPCSFPKHNKDNRFTRKVNIPYTFVVFVSYWYLTPGTFLEKKEKKRLFRHNSYFIANIFQCSSFIVLFILMKVS